MDSSNFKTEGFQNRSLLASRSNGFGEESLGDEFGRSRECLPEIGFEQMVVQLCGSDEHPLGRLPTFEGRSVRISPTSIGQVPNERGGKRNGDEFRSGEDLHYNSQKPFGDVSSLGIFGGREHAAAIKTRDACNRICGDNEILRAIFSTGVRAGIEHLGEESDEWYRQYRRDLGYESESGDSFESDFEDEETQEL